MKLNFKISEGKKDWIDFILTMIAIVIILMSYFFLESVIDPNKLTSLKHPVQEEPIRIEYDINNIYHFNQVMYGTGDYEKNILKSFYLGDGIEIKDIDKTSLKFALISEFCNVAKVHKFEFVNYKSNSRYGEALKNYCLYLLN